MRDSVKIMSNWLDNFKDVCTEEQLKEIYYRIIQYGLYEKWIEKEDDDPLVKIAMNFISPQIDAMQDAYEERIEKGKHGRAGKLNSYQIWTWAREGKKAKEIAELLGGISINSVYSNAGWKAKDNDNFY